MFAVLDQHNMPCLLGYMRFFSSLKNGFSFSLYWPQSKIHFFFMIELYSNLKPKFFIVVSSNDCLLVSQLAVVLIISSFLLLLYTGMPNLI